MKGNKMIEDIPRDNADMSNEKGIPRLKLMGLMNGLLVWIH